MRIFVFRPSLFAAMAIAGLTMFSWLQPERAESAVLVVTKTADTADGVCNADCSLREAITAANASPGQDTINFNIPGPGPHTIQPTGTALPIVSEAATIDGYSQPGASPNTNPPDLGSNAVIMIELDGWDTPLPPQNPSWGLRVSGGSSTIRGLAVNRFFGMGIWVDGAGGNAIEGNFVGTDTAGGADRGNHDHGILINGAPNNVIGGAAPYARNVISGNGRSGIEVYGQLSVGSTVIGNIVGLNKQGTAAIANLTGVTIGDARSITVGGTTLAERNVISGNQEGIRVCCGGADENVVRGNFVGTNPAGTAAIGNSGTGVAVGFGSGNFIGGSSPGAGNVISGNGTGLQIGETEAAGNVVQGNLIGTDAAGTSAIGNSSDGIQIVASNNTIGGSGTGEGNVISGNYRGILVGPGNYANTPSRNLIEGNLIGTDKTGGASVGNITDGIWILNAANNTIGGNISGAANVIAHNAYSGIRIDGDTSTGNKVSRNTIHSNGGLGIDLAVGSNGVTLHDPGDADNGSNNLQNFPDLTGLLTAFGALNITGSLHSQPSSEYALQFFSSPTCDLTGYGEGKTFLGAEAISTDSSGMASFGVSFTNVAGEYAVAATATDPEGNTSEFSNCMIPSTDDSDGDGVTDSNDPCPGTPEGAAVDPLGCSLAQVDSDGDGVCNDNAPSNGPSPGCVRSVAVGGVMGLLDGGTAPIVSAEPVGLNGAHMRMAMIRDALVAMVLVGVGVWRLRRRA